MTEIGGLRDAINYWRTKKGGTVKANNKLIEEIKKSMTKSLNKDIIPGVINKIKQSKKDKTYHVKNAPGSRRGYWCLTLGSFSINIEYDYDFKSEPGRKKHEIKFHFYGYDTWDFECKKVAWYNIPGHLNNLVEEIIPNKIAGDGTPFNVTYDFYWSHTLQD